MARTFTTQRITQKEILGVSLCLKYLRLGGEEAGNLKTQMEMLKKIIAIIPTPKPKKDSRAL